MPKQRTQEMFQNDGADDAATGRSDEEGDWIEQELAGCEFADERLGTRFRRLIQQLSKNWRAHSSCLPGLGQYESCLPVSL
jgi:hypothetical protein